MHTHKPVDPECLVGTMSDEVTDYVPNSDSESEFESYHFPANTVSGTGKKEAQSRKSNLMILADEISTCYTADEGMSTPEHPRRPCRDVMSLQPRIKEHLTPDSPIDSEHSFVYTQSDEDPDYLPHSNSESEGQSDDYPEDVDYNGTGKRKLQYRNSTVKKRMKIANCSKAGNTSGYTEMPQQASKQRNKMPQEASTPDKQMPQQASIQGKRMLQQACSQYSIPSTSKPIMQTFTGTQSVPLGGTYKKPFRYCIFCKKMWSKLRVHIEKMHKGVARVYEALKMGKKERVLEFDAFRKEGILEVNNIRLRKNPDNPKLERERRENKGSSKKGTSKLVMCHLCKAFVEKRYISRHEKFHANNSDAACESIPVPVDMLSVANANCGGDFIKEIVSKFREGEDPDTCRGILSAFAEININ